MSVTFLLLDLESPIFLYSIFFTGPCVLTHTFKWMQTKLRRHPLHPTLYRFSLEKLNFESISCTMHNIFAFPPFPTFRNRLVSKIYLRVKKLLIIAQLLEKKEPLYRKLFVFLKEPINIIIF